MMVLHGYQVDETQWKAKGGGGQCNVGTKGGKQYFIKRLTKPRYPESNKFTGEFRRKKIEECDQWLKTRKAIANALPGNGTGTLIKPIEYFRDGPCFYEIANMVDVTSIPFDQIWKESKQDKARIMLTVAMSLADVHKVGVVHGDLDPGNILISRSAGGNLVTKLIDFTDSFFANDPPDTIMSKDFWWSPEVALYSKATSQVPNPYKKFISTKADVFSLGIVFHQYCSKNGAAPICKAPQPWQEFSLGRTPQIDPAIDPDFANLIQSMLEIEPDKRPSMADVHHTLLDILKGNPRKTVEQKPAPQPAPPPPAPVKRERITSPVPPTAKRTTASTQPSTNQGELTPGLLVKSAIQLNPRKVKIVFENGKEQIMDLKLAILQKYVLED